MAIWLRRVPQHVRLPHRQVLPGVVLGTGRLWEVRLVHQKIGKPCDGNLDPSSSTPSSPNVDPFYGDAMLCGIYIQYKNREVNSTVRVAPWAGVCVNGKCRECNSYMMYTPWHTSSLWYTASAQNLNANQRLECLWSGATHSIGTNAPYKRRPRRCSNFGWEHTNGIAVAAPAALLLIASAVFAL